MRVFGVKWTHKLVFLALMAFFGARPAHSLGMADILASLERQPATDTINMRISLTLQSSGIISNMQMHLISKGPEKTWVEMNGPSINQRIVRNGSRYQVTDLATGKKTIPEMPPAMPGVQPAASQAMSLLKTGNYAPPTQLGPQTWRLDLVPGSDPSVKERSLVFDTGLDQIVGITEVSPTLDSTVTSIEFGAAPNLGVPMKMTIQTKGKNTGSLITMAFSQVVKPASISEKLFEIN